MMLILVSAVAITATESAKASRPIPIPTPTPTTIPYNGVFGMIDTTGKIIPYNGPATVDAEFGNYTFYLPVKSYVSVDAGGEIMFYGSFVSIGIAMDGTNGNISSGTFCFRSDEGCFDEFHVNRVYYLNPGSHTISINGRIGNTNPNNVTKVYTTITAIASDKGNLVIK